MERPAGRRARHPLFHGFQELARIGGRSGAERVMLASAFIYGVQTGVLVLVPRDQLESGADAWASSTRRWASGVLGAVLVSRLVRSARVGTLSTCPCCDVAADGRAPVTDSVGRRSCSCLCPDRLGRRRRAHADNSSGAVPGDVLDASGVRSTRRGAAFIVGSLVWTGGDPPGDRERVRGVRWSCPAGTARVSGLLAPTGKRRVLARIGPAVAVFETRRILEDTAGRRQRLARAATALTVAIGADVVVQGAPASIYVIESGRLDVLRRTGREPPVQVNVLAAGDSYR